MKINLNQQIAIGAVAGITVGGLLSYLGANNPHTQTGVYFLGLIGSFFIGLLKMVLIPLVFSTIVVGVANLKAHQQIHRVWITTLLFFMFSMAVAMILALAVANFLEPGKGMHLAMFAGATEHFNHSQLTTSEFFQNFFQNLFQNPISALAKGDVLAIIIFALFLGVALVTGGDRFKNILAVFQEFLELMMKILNCIIKLAPVGIFALLAKLVATQDLALLNSLLYFIAIIIGTTLFHGLVLLPLILFIATKKSPFWFLRGARPAMITALATASSSATLPVSLKCAEENLGVDNNIASFVIPLGATINMDGTALYEAAAALFIANLAGIELNFVQQLIIFITAMIGAMGAPGIPSVGMASMVLVLQSVGLPVEAIAILLPIDRLLDTIRTAVNVEGDIVGSVIVQKLVNQK